MAETKKETIGQEPSTQPVVDLLTDILEEFRQQVPSRAAAPLEPAALKAQRAFIEISEQLDVEPE